MAKMYNTPSISKWLYEQHVPRDRIKGLRTNFDGRKLPAGLVLIGTDVESPARVLGWELTRH